MQNQPQNPNDNLNNPLQLKSEQVVKNQFNLSALLLNALDDDAIISQAYSSFHNYSLLNQSLAAFQLMLRFGKLSPIASYKTWQEKGRQVKKNEKAIALYMPVIFKKKNNETEQDTESNDDEVYTKIILRNNWFCLDQTEGEEYIPEIKIPSWNAEKAMAVLDIVEIHFDSVNGNCMGFAKNNQIAINPLNPLKHKTRFHEMAHILLGHTKDTYLSENADLPKSIKEVEAEGVAFLMLNLLNLDGKKESRGYIQGWLQGNPISEESAKRIFTVTDKLFKAGQ